MSFPYFDPVPRTSGRELAFPQATQPLDIVCRGHVAAWLLQYTNGSAVEVTLYTNEVLARNITTAPVTGREIRAYTVARNLLELAERGPDWDAAVTVWIDIFIDIAGIGPVNLWETGDVGDFSADGYDIIQYGVEPSLPTPLGLGELYRVEFDCVNITNSIYVRIGGTYTVIGTGHYDTVHTCVDENWFYFQNKGSTDTTGNITNIIVTHVETP